MISVTGLTITSKNFSKNETCVQVFIFVLIISYNGTMQNEESFKHGIVYDAGEFPGLESLPTKSPSSEESKLLGKNEFVKLRKEVIELQRALYAENKQSLLIVFQALDCGGKDGTIRKVFQGINPQGVHVASFKRPTETELEHDFLWRIHRHTPAQGMISIFNRSHYEDVLVPLVENLAPLELIKKRYAHINNFEACLMDHGTRILKFFLNISKDEQARRLQSRLDRPDKRWKFEPQDLRKRADWTAYMLAFKEMFAACSSERAPWYIIPSDDKWYRNLVITRILLAELKKMDPEYPVSRYDLSDITIE